MSTHGSFQVAAAHDLAARFAQVSAVDVFAEFAGRVVRRKDDSPFLEPYVPLVGPQYAPGGVLVYATAQNLAGAGSGEPVAGDPMFRLWPGFARPTGAAVMCPHRDVRIQPWSDGILPALVQAWHIARGGRAVDVCATTAVSNFYKFSFTSEDQRRDINPVKLERERVNQYTNLMLDAYVRHELELLAPSVVITFAGPQAAALRKHLGSRCSVVEVNDPSWVKRGMSGVARPGGSWRTEVERAASRLAAHELEVDRALDRCEPSYKRPGARIYLLRYLLRWMSSPDSPRPSNGSPPSSSRP